MQNRTTHRMRASFGQGVPPQVAAASVDVQGQVEVRMPAAGDASLPAKELLAISPRLKSLATWVDMQWVMCDG